MEGFDIYLKIDNACDVMSKIITESNQIGNT